MNRKKYNSQKAFALISTLLLLTLLGMLTLSIIAIVQYTNAQASISTTFSRSYYDAESACNRAIYSLYRDLRIRPDRKLGETNYEFLSAEAFLADSIEHIFLVNDEIVIAQILDASSGIDISGNSPDHNLRETFRNIIGNDSKAREEFEKFLDKVKDYIDSDDFVGNYGMEETHYRNSGIPVLPRNSSFQFREELLVIPDAQTYFKTNNDGVLDIIRLIPSGNMRKIPGRMNLYSAPMILIQAACNLNGEETEELENSFRLWREERKCIGDTLSPFLYNRLATMFSTYESGVYTFRVKSQSGDYASRKLTVTLRVDSLGPQFEYYDYRYY